MGSGVSTMSVFVDIAKLSLPLLMPALIVNESTPVSLFDTYVTVSVGIVSPVAISLKFTLPGESFKVYVKSTILTDG
jgi:hypothetical protein